MPVTFDGSEAGGLPEFAPPCREWLLPTGEVVYVHGYTGRDVNRWRFLALTLSGVTPPAEPPAWALEMAQAVHVCRVAPGSEERTFRILHGGEKQAADHLRSRLPGRFVEVVCSLSDGLAMEGYSPTEEEAELARHDKARVALRTMLEDRRFWAALNLVSVRLFGEPLTESRRPIGAVYQALVSDRDRQDALLKAIGPLATMGGG